MVGGGNRRVKQQERGWWRSDHPILEGFKIYYVLIFQFSPTNNEAEYEVFISGLRYVKDIGAQYVKIRTAPKSKEPSKQKANDWLNIRTKRLL